MTNLVLASASPRRAQLLMQIGVPFSILPADIDETRLPNESALTYVQRMAAAKANALTLTDKQVVLAADTTVACEGRVLEKPQDLADAKAMLRWLSGKQQQVYSAFFLGSNDKVIKDYSCTHVTFRSLTDEQIDRYLATNEYVDKAGAYGIQGYGAALIAELNGSYSGVVGLAIEKLVPALEAMGIDCWEQIDD